MLICLTGYCMAKSGFDRTITQPPKLFQLRKLEIQQSLRIDSTVYLIYWWWFPTPVVRCAVSHNSDVPKVTPYFVCKLLFMGIASFYTLLRNNRINWNVQCWSMLKLILSQGSKRDSLVQPGDFPGEVPREKACAMTCKRADAELSVVRVGHLATAFWNWARWDTMGYHGILILYHGIPTMDDFVICGPRFSDGFMTFQTSQPRFSDGFMTFQASQMSLFACHDLWWWCDGICWRFAWRAQRNVCCAGTARERIALDLRISMGSSLLNGFFWCRLPWFSGNSLGFIHWSKVIWHVLIGNTRRLHH